MLLSAENPQSNFIQTGEKRSFEYIRRSSAVGLGCFSWRQAGKQGHLLMQLTCYYIVFCSQSTTVTFQNSLTVSGITLHTTRCLVIWASYSVKKKCSSVLGIESRSHSCQANVPQPLSYCPGKLFVFLQPTLGVSPGSCWPYPCL